MFSALRRLFSRPAAPRGVLPTAPWPVGDLTPAVLGRKIEEMMQRPAVAQPEQPPRKIKNNSKSRDMRVTVRVEGELETVTLSPGASIDIQRGVFHAARMATPPKSAHKRSNAKRKAR